MKKSQHTMKLNNKVVKKYKYTYRNCLMTKLTWRKDAWFDVV